MPETRFQLVEVYDKTGHRLNTEQAAYEVSDGALALEEVRKLEGELAAVDDSNLTLAQVVRLVRVLARAAG